MRSSAIAIAIVFASAAFAACATPETQPARTGAAQIAADGGVTPLPGAWSREGAGPGPAFERQPCHVAIQQDDGRYGRPSLEFGLTQALDGGRVSGQRQWYGRYGCTPD